LWPKIVNRCELLWKAAPAINATNRSSTLDAQTEQPLLFPPQEQKIRLLNFYLQIKELDCNFRVVRLALNNA
jgi:hypothetical protein